MSNELAALNATIDKVLAYHPPRKNKPKKKQRLAPSCKNRGARTKKSGNIQLAKKALN